MVFIELALKRVPFLDGFSLCKDFQYYPHGSDVPAFRNEMFHLVPLSPPAGMPP